MPGEAMPFSEWMHRALYDPQRGYYVRQIRTVGRRGDFSTSTTISTALGEAIAAWLRTESVNQPKVRTIIEIGGGNGDLMHAVRRALGWRLRWKFRSLMVEASPVLKEAQQKTLQGAGIHWHTDLIAALQSCGGHAFLFHNELLDAFPVTLVEWNAAQETWSEIWLTQTTAQNRWTEERRPLWLPEEMHGRFHALDWRPTTSTQRCELGAAARDWFQGWAPHWRAGVMLTLDYGDEFPQLYHRRPSGLLRAYQAHQLFTGPEIYEGMGRRDITADVNFSDVCRWGEALGWQHEPLQTQREFLRQHLRDFDTRMASDRALSFLADEHGAGGEFKALVQRPAG